MEAGEAIAAGASINDLTTEYKKFLRNEISVFTMWDRFTSIIK